MINLEALSAPLLIDKVIGDEICFEVNDVFSKYGFGDGDMLSDLFYEYLVIKHNLARSTINIYPNLTATKALKKVFEKYIESSFLPKLTIEYFDTPHNGIRCSDDSGGLIFPEHIYVKITDILTVFDEMVEEDVRKYD